MWVFCIYRAYTTYWKMILLFKFRNILILLKLWVLTIFHAFEFFWHLWVLLSMRVKNYNVTNLGNRYQDMTLFEIRRLEHRHNQHHHNRGHCIFYCVFSCHHMLHCSHSIFPTVPIRNLLKIGCIHSTNYVRFLHQKIKKIGYLLQARGYKTMKKF